MRRPVSSTAAAPLGRFVGASAAVRNETTADGRPSIESPTAAHPRRDTRDVAALVLLVGTAMLLWLPRLTGPIDLRYDAGVYYVLGTALARGAGYRLLNEPGEILAIQYPPALPAIVAAHQLLLGTDDPVRVGIHLRTFFFLVFIAYLVAIYMMARQHTSARYAFLTAFICALTLQTFFLSDFNFSELPFSLASVVAIYVNSRSARFGTVAISSALVVLSFLLRSMGVALIAAWIFESIAKRDVRQAGFRTMIALTPVIMWQVYVGWVQASSEYRSPSYEYQRADWQYYNVSYAQNVLLIDPFVPELGRASWNDLVNRVLLNAFTMPESIGEAVSEPVVSSRRTAGAASHGQFLWHVPAWVPSMAMSVLGCLVIIGVCTLARRQEWLIVGYIAGTVVLTCLTPWPGQFTRYLAPVAPCLILSLLLALAATARYLHAVLPRRWRALAGAPTIIVVSAILVVQCLTVGVAYGRGREVVVSYDRAGRPVPSSRFYYGASWRAFDVAVEWLATRAAPDDVVASSSPHLVYLRTGLKAVMPPFEPIPERADHLLRSVPVKYVIVDELGFIDVSRRYAEPIVRQYPDRWRLVYADSTSELRIYERVD